MIYGFVSAALCISLFLYFELKKNYLTAFYFKALSSFSFLSVFGIAVYVRNDGFKSFDLFVMLGLIMGLLGDLILALRTLRPKSEDHTIIIKGMSVFSIGHIFYMIALLQFQSISIYAIILSIFMTVIVIIFSYVLKFEMGKVKYLSYFYSLLIFFMIGQALGIYVKINTFNQGLMMILIGAIFFGISDLILAPIYFKGANKNILILLNLVTYYTAQLLIASAILYV